MNTSPRPLNIVGILNVTADSFSDGKRYLDTQHAIEQGLKLAADGADIIDIGAEATSVNSEKITVEEEIKRLTPVIQALKEQDIRISADTYKPEVMKQAISLGVDMINDVNGLTDEEAIKVVKEADIPVVIMFNRNPDVRARATSRDHTTVMDEMENFFSNRLKALHEAGIPDDNIIIDPGMGLFIGGAKSSLMALRHIENLKKFDRDIYVSVSRKSVIGEVLNQPVESRGIGTLAAEIWAYLHGVSYIRTHEPGPLRQSVTMIQAIEGIEEYS